jgi:hypothetical protein
VRRGHLLLVLDRCQAEVDELRRAVGGDEDVRALDVAVSDAGVVGILQALARPIIIGRASATVTRWRMRRKSLRFEPSMNSMIM